MAIPGDCDVHARLQCVADAVAVDLEAGQIDIIEAVSFRPTPFSVTPRRVVGRWLYKKHHAGKSESATMTE